MEQWLAKINKLTAWQVAIVISVVGFAVFFSGLNSPFMGDDLDQIVNNVPVHSIANFRLFFEGSTFYEGAGLKPLGGHYYRPLMTVAYSVLYTLFGAHAFAFHVLQYLLCIGSSIFLYLFLRYFFGSLLALVSALIFLVHPINSQVAFALPSLQDALFFFFGMLTLWLLVRFKSIGSLGLAAICLFFSLLSKEAGMLFVLMATLYLLWFDRKRVLPFVGIISTPIIIYLFLKIQAVGLLTTSYNGPIDTSSLAQRLLTVPSILLFYIIKFISPVRLASAYFWTYPNFSLQHVMLPLIVDVLVIAAFIYLGFVIRQRLATSMFLAYIFFSVWTIVGLSAYMQIVPLDFTASETWFYFPMVGIIGMIGILLVAYQDYVKPSWFFIVTALVIGLLGVRTGLRGLDWRSESTLANTDIAASKEDYVAYHVLAATLFDAGSYGAAETDEVKSINIYPNWKSYSNLGLILMNGGDYPGAQSAYLSALKFGGTNDVHLVYENLSDLALLYGSDSSNMKLLNIFLQKYPHDADIWSDLAILEERNNNNSAARVSISKAANYGEVSRVVYDDIMRNRPFTLYFANRNLSVK